MKDGTSKRIVVDLKLKHLPPTKTELDLKYHELYIDQSEHKYNLGHKLFQNNIYEKYSDIEYKKNKMNCWVTVCIILTYFLVFKNVYI